MSDLIRREDVLRLAESGRLLSGSFGERAKDIISSIPTAEPKEYVKDGTLTVQMPTIKEAKAIDKIVVYADTYKQEYYMPKVGKWISVSSFEAFGGDEICWEIRGNPTAFHYCSACKEQAYVDEFGNEILSKHCPECGAKMERSE